MEDQSREVVCIWGKRRNLKINGDKVHGCPLRARTTDGTIDLNDCKLCASHVKIVENGSK